ncbi:hypothetical protein V5O48_015829 [Marasmius crinis-equi]|uniref:Uncharacterized protein n=1 Tax=Marasmius crinis-equi TaxID=585013 RepID=A0ABR3ETH6_9AGAR
MLAAWEQGQEVAATSFVNMIWVEWIKKWPEADETDERKRQRAKKDLAQSVTFAGYRTAFIQIDNAKKHGEAIPSGDTPQPEPVDWQTQFLGAVERLGEGEGE